VDALKSARTKWNCTLNLRSCRLCAKVCMGEGDVWQPEISKGQNPLHQFPCSK